LLVGARQEAWLTLEDFAHVSEGDMLRRLLAGALTHRAAGINILIHGPRARARPKSRWPWPPRWAPAARHWRGR
jgi:hypothetical protein